MILSLAYLWEAGMMLTWSTLRGCADLDHVVLGTACWLVGSVFLLLGVAHPPDAWKLGTVDGLVVRVAFLLLGVAVLLLGVAFLLDRWSLVGVPFLLFGVAALAGIGFMVSLLIGELAYGVADRRAVVVRSGVLASALLAGSASRRELLQSERRLPRPGRNRGTRQRRRRHSRRVRGEHACHDG
jgi:hypothetical protein